MQARTILITGGGRGLGRATAENLARQGHRVLLTVRDAGAGERARRDIRAAVAGADVKALLADMASLTSVRALADGLEHDGVVLDVLFNNAGIMQQSKTRRLSVDGFEETLAVNTLAPFVLVERLLPALSRAKAGRVVNVTSRLHLPGSRGVPVDYDFDDPNLERGYDPDRAYKNSKLAILWVTYELARRLKAQDSRVTANAVCPGFVPTTAAASVTGFTHFLLSKVLVHLPFARSVEEATDSFTFMALDPSLEGVSGAFYGEKQRLRSSPQSYDQDQAKRFCDWAQGVTGIASWPV